MQHIDWNAVWLGTLAACGGVAGIAAFALKVVEPLVKPLAHNSGVVLVHAIQQAPPGLRPFVLREVADLSKDPEAAKVTTTELAQHILAKAAPMFPSAVLGDVLQIVGEATFAFNQGVNQAALAALGAPVSAVTPPAP